MSGTIRIPHLAAADWLRREYVDNGRTQQHIAAELGCGQTAVARALSRHGIPSRPQGPRSERVTRALGDTFDELTHIVDETVEQLRRDFKHRTPASALALRVHRVHDAQQAHDVYAERQALLDLAALSMLSAKDVGRRRS